MQYCAKSKSGNIIISPLSVATSLALLSQASDGATFEELRNGLHMNGDDKFTIAEKVSDFYDQLHQNMGNTTLLIANQIYVQQGREINDDFQEVAVTKFQSDIVTLDFADTEQSADIINYFVEEKTEGKIQNIIAPNSLNANIALFLVNAVYFKGNWEYKFNKEHTREEVFYLNRNETVRTDFMSIKNKFHYARLPELNATALEMRYNESSLSFVILLPNSRSGLSELESKLRSYDQANIFKQMHRRKLHVTIPKFKINFEVKMNSVLKEVRLSNFFHEIFFGSF